MEMESLPIMQQDSTNGLLRLLDCFNRNTVYLNSKHIFRYWNDSFLLFREMIGGPGFNSSNLVFLVWAIANMNILTR